MKCVLPLSAAHRDEVCSTPTYNTPPQRVPNMLITARCLSGGVDSAPGERHTRVSQLPVQPRSASDNHRLFKTRPVQSFSKGGLAFASHVPPFWSCSHPAIASPIGRLSGEAEDAQVQKNGREFDTKEGFYRSFIHFCAQRPTELLVHLAYVLIVKCFLKRNLKQMWSCRKSNTILLTSLHTTRTTYPKVSSLHLQNSIFTVFHMHLFLPDCTCTDANKSIVHLPIYKVLCCTCSRRFLLCLTSSINCTWHQIYVKIVFLCLTACV